MKKVFLCILFSLFLSAFSQEPSFHILYVRLDVSADKSTLLDSLTKYIEDVEHEEHEDFVVYVSNTSEIFTKKKLDKQNLIGTIYELNSFAALPGAMYELEKLSSILEENLEENVKCKKTGNSYISQKYKNIKLVCFVDEEFIEDKMDSAFIAKFLFLYKNLRPQIELITRPNKDLKDEFDFKDNLYIY